MNLRISIYVIIMFILVSGCRQKANDVGASGEDSQQVVCEVGQKLIERSSPYAESYCVGKEGREGLWRQWDDEGNLVFEGHYHHDIQQGVWTRYHPTGGKFQEGELVDGLREGVWMEWYSDGSKRSEKLYRDGLQNGRSRIFYRSGSVMSEGDFINNMEQGLWRVYNESGVLIRECEMKDGEEIKCDIKE